MKRAGLLGALVIFAAGPALAAPEHLATIEAECAAQLKMPPAICTCLRDKAAGMNDGQQAFVAATVTKDKATQQALTPGMTVQELTEAGMFMANAPAQCARGQ
jgi:hypothetical protein